ncbi:MAG TPA: glycosyltransferase [Chthoniobacteraceae bacterium]|jgi:glycosyltransferase involved in cell wall biosynthesis|nr:glycosyltransferase [Chthoniobacteraceae bacterium]
MRIALFIDSDVFAGTERHIVDLARALRDQSMTVAIACPTASPLNRLASDLRVETIRIEKRGLVDFAAVLKLRRLLASGEIDVIHSHNGRTALISAIAGLLAGKGALVATQHFIDPAHATVTGWRSGIARAAHRWVQRRTRRYIAVSQAAQRSMVRRESGLAGKVNVIPNGILPLEPARLAPPEKIRAEFDLPPNAPLIVCAARLAKEKDLPVLIDAMNMLAAEFPGARCIIAGDGPERSALERQIRMARYGSRIILAGFREDPLSLIHAGDLFVLPSRAEPFGLVLLEAMALGKPVIATAAGGPLEIVKDGETGLLVPPGDAAAMAGAIARILRDQEFRSAAGAEGRARFERQFTAGAMASATIETYGRALCATKPAVPCLEEKICES